MTHTFYSGCYVGESTSGSYSDDDSGDKIFSKIVSKCSETRVLGEVSSLLDVRWNLFDGDIVVAIKEMFGSKMTIDLVFNEAGRYDVSSDRTSMHGTNGSYMETYWIKEVPKRILYSPRRVLNPVAILDLHFLAWRKNNDLESSDVLVKKVKF